MSARNLLILSICVRKQYCDLNKLQPLLTAWEKDRSIDFLEHLVSKGILTRPQRDDLRQELQKQEPTERFIPYDRGPTEFDSGGMGTVYRRQDRDFGREVAVKKVKSKFDYALILPALQRRLRREALITGLLEHPGVVPMYAYGRDDAGKPYCAMKVIRGGSLLVMVQKLKHKSWQHMSAEDRRDDLDRLLQHFIRACRTVGFAHNKGFVHRDLKPDHIYLASHRLNAQNTIDDLELEHCDQTLVIDWGLGKKYRGSPLTELSAEASEEIEEELTGDGDTTGTDGYMSPEHAKHGLAAVEPPGDIYSLGAVLYFLITGGDHAFPKKSIHEPRSERLERVINGDFQPPRTYFGAVSEPLVGVCLKAMQREPKNRYASAEELAEDVLRWQKGERVHLGGQASLEDDAHRWLRHAMMQLALGSSSVALYKGVLDVAEQQAVGVDIAKGYHSLGLVSGSRQPRLAIEAYLCAERVWERRLQADPNDLDARNGLCKSLNNLIPLYRQTDRLDEAREVADKAVAHMRRLVGPNPANSTGSVGLEYCDGFVVTLLNLGNVLLDRRQLQEAEQAYEEAVTVSRAVTAAARTNSTFRMHLIAALQGMGKAQASQSKLENAHECYKESLLELEQLVAEAPGVGDYQRHLVAGHQRVASVVAKLGLGDLVEKHLVRALTILEQQRQPGQEWVFEYVRLSATLALEYSRQGKHAEALARLDKAGQELAVLESDSDSPQTQELRRQLALNSGLIFTQLGQHEKALEAWDDALKLGEAQDWLRFQRALSQARLGRVDDVNDLAVVWRDCGDAKQKDMAGCIFAQRATYWLVDKDAPEEKRKILIKVNARYAAVSLLMALKEGAKLSLPAEVIRGDAIFAFVRDDEAYVALLQELDRSAQPPQGE